MDTCRNCKNNERGRCKILDDLLLIRTISKKDGKESIIRSVAILTDKAVDLFRCNYF